MADHKIRLVQSVAAGATHLPDRIYPATAATDHLQALAIQASEYSRFRVDPGFEADVADRLYAEWLRQAFTQDLTHEVLVYQAHDDLPATGVLILRNTEERTEIAIIAVDKGCRGRGLGSLLIEAARCRARARNQASLQVVTQAGNPARRLYEREGFRLEHEEYLYHLWL
ncbi:GNAT family N-acetyltransferase [Hymenobacter cavernae]|uniref:GNAT family N-acetyltransferase n=1 Tax=Hymenobacter cavernae TaxID=2044852 RepID=UPI001667D945|nr:GNAT family N-acetyltransferase [Hymenobacter cavernae]